MHKSESQGVLKYYYLQKRSLQRCEDEENYTTSDETLT